jgi:hypothetical protein
MKKVFNALRHAHKGLAEFDGRGPELHRLRQLVKAHVSDLGGDDFISHSEKVLVHRSAMLTLQLEMMENTFGKQAFKATPEQLDVYQRVTNSVRRLFETLGLQRRARHVDGDLNEYLRGKQRKGEGIALNGEDA